MNLVISRLTGPAQVRKPSSNKSIRSAWRPPRLSVRFIENPLWKASPWQIDHSPSSRWMSDARRWLGWGGGRPRACISGLRTSGALGTLCCRWIHRAHRPGGEPFSDNFGALRTYRGPDYLDDPPQRVIPDKFVRWWSGDHQRALPTPTLLACSVSFSAVSPKHPSPATSQCRRNPRCRFRTCRSGGLPRAICVSDSSPPAPLAHRARGWNRTRVGR